MSSKVNPGRLAAARALIAVDQGGHVEDALSEASIVSDKDRSLAWYLALGTLRRRGQVDAALRPLLRQPLESLDVEVRAALRVGTFDKLFSRTAAHAAVHQGVELAAALGVGRAKGLVNAVLRRARLPERMGRADALDHPPWLVRRWEERYGAEACDRWCAENGENPPLFLVARDAEAEASLVERGVGQGSVAVGGEVLPRVLRASEGGRVDALPGFAEGLFWVQDAASVAVADLVQGQGTVLDACAAPGGKTLRLASRGFAVTATDVDDQRLGLLRGSLERVGLSAEASVHDWTAGPGPFGTFDAVLVDAPCTGLGTVRRHPEVRWRRVESDCARAGTRQRAILVNAATHVRPGGQLVYAVCSPEPEEGQSVIDAFLREHADFALDRIMSSAPPSSGEDAFFGARMVRR